MDEELVEEMLAHLKTNALVDFEPNSSVAEFYSNRSVFITGATGFIGKALVEKLVRSCRDIKRIYLLIREKRGKDINERLAELIQSRIFGRIRAQPNGEELLKDKLRAIRGDITCPKFGVTQEDMKVLASEVSIVFNSAATIRFIEPIDVAVKNNIYSVSQLVEFCDGLENLKALVHLSTAFSNCHKKDTIYEIFYEPPMSGDQIISAVNSLRQVQNDIHVYPTKPSSLHHHHQQTITGGSGGGGDDETFVSRDECIPQIFFARQDMKLPNAQNFVTDLLDEFTQIALKKSNRPNTYTFTKAIAESYLLDLVKRRPQRYLGDKIPVAIVRPSIVGGAWREPDVGYVDNYNGPTGAILSLYTGSLQAMPGKGERVADMVPCDMVVNMLTSLGWYLVSEYEDLQQQQQQQLMTTTTINLNEQITHQHHQMSHNVNDNNNSNNNNMNNRNRNNSVSETSTTTISTSNRASGALIGGKIKKDHGAYVFNFVSGYRNPLHWGQVTQLIAELAYKYPSKFLARLPSSYFIRAGKFYNLYDKLNHKVPAFVQDFVKANLLRQELNDKSSALTYYGKIRAMTSTLTPFTSNQWRLCDSNVVALYDSLSSSDRKLFEFDIRQVDWTAYIRNYIIGARLYTLKDDANNVPQALKSLKK